MSKSIGNVIYPAEVISKYGADILRLWVASSDFKADIRVSVEILNQLSEVYRKIRNTCRFLLGNLYDFNPAQDLVPYEELAEIDRWALGRLVRLVQKVTRAYDEYEYHLLYHNLHNFCAIDMSAVYLDIIKDRIYCSEPLSRERRAAQTVMYHVINTIVGSWPRSWSIRPRKSGITCRQQEKEASVHLLDWPELPGNTWMMSWRKNGRACWL